MAATLGAFFVFLGLDGPIPTRSFAASIGVGAGARCERDVVANVIGSVDAVNTVSFAVVLVPRIRFGGRLASAGAVGIVRSVLGRISNSAAIAFRCAISENVLCRLANSGPVSMVISQQQVNNSNTIDYIKYWCVLSTKFVYLTDCYILMPHIHLSYLMPHIHLSIYCHEDSLA